MEKKELYRLDDDISFRKCSLSDGPDSDYGDCTNFKDHMFCLEEHSYSCNQEGIHFHCTRHPEIELEYADEFDPSILTCPRCKNQIEIGNMEILRSRCLRMMNRQLFKGAKIIRLDDWYVHEIEKKEKSLSDYWVTVDVKKDKDGDTMIVLYVGHKASKGKCQYFIKPEKLQLTNDHKDMDPARIISKIEVTLKDRTLIQQYDD